MGMKPNLTLAAGVWHDFYAVTGFAPGSNIIGCSGGTNRICFYEGDQPAHDLEVCGWQISSREGFKVQGQSVWVRGNNGVTLCGLQQVEAGARNMITPFIGDVMGGGQDAGGQQQGVSAVELTYKPSSGDTIQIDGAGSAQFVSVLLTQDASVDGVQLLLPADNVPGRRVVISSISSAGVTVTTPDGKVTSGLELHDGWAIEFALVSASAGVWAQIS